MRTAGLLLTLCFSLASSNELLAQQYSNLLDGKSLSQWMLPNGEDVKEGWQFDPDGTLHLAGKGNNIITKDEYQDFDLWFEYRISEKGNSGIKYRVAKFGNSWLGCEYQIQDDSAFPKLPAKHYTASLYDVFDKSSPILERRYLAPTEFSVGRIIVQNHRIRHWMNGNLIIDERDDSPRFQEAIQKSKFRSETGFGTNASGRLMLTDHGSEVWYRNLYIRRLNNCAMIP
ncbi:MAG: DUF1080 domain-containing protein [Planctomycetaceae bacterium]